MERQFVQCSFEQRLIPSGMLYSATKGVHCIGLWDYSLDGAFRLCFTSEYKLSDYMWWNILMDLGLFDKVLYSWVVGWNCIESGYGHIRSKAMKRELVKEGW